MRREPFANMEVKTSLIRIWVTALSTTAPLAPSNNRPRRGPSLRTRHCWMLLLAFEILVLGFAQSMFQPVRQPGILIEMSVTPNHVVT